MASRALAFSDPEVIALATSAFVPVALDCSVLQSQQDAEGDFFRLVAEQGHYGGRVVPTSTRQGQYACTADGMLLASINTRDAANMLAMMRSALDRWPSRAGRRGDDGGDGPGAVPERRGPPEGGLVLRVFTRDLPRAPAAGRDAAPGGAAGPDWRSRAVNHDHLWFTADEAALLVPDPALPGAARGAADGLARRVARFHMIDIVRGETPMWRPAEVGRAELRSTVEAVGAEGVRLRLDGSFRCAAQGTWAVRPFGPRLEGLSRGFEARLLGRATWDPAARRFTAFEAVAAGVRWGGSEHNLRWDDLEPAPMAVLFELADGSAPGDAIAPEGARGHFSGRDYWSA